MARSKKFDFDSEMYLGLSASEIKDAIVRNVKQASKLRKEAKDFMSGVNDTLKELEARNEAALEALADLEVKSVAA